MFTLETGASGTVSSSVTAAPWSDQYAVLTDAPGAYVEIWKLDEPVESDRDIPEYSTAKVVARLDTEVEGCCGNALWVD
jgi:hypothetical protein